MAEKRGDAYSNFAIISVTESAANTLTFQKLETGVGLFERVGWVISRVDWYLRGAYPQFNTSGDSLAVALCQSNAISGIGATSSQVLLNKVFYRQDYGTAASGFFIAEPDTTDLSSLPGGGLLVLPNPLFIAAHGSGLAAAVAVTARLWYKNISLSDADYFDLMQSRQILTS